jgi:hypothetical protein
MSIFSMLLYGTVIRHRDNCNFAFASVLTFQGENNIMSRARRGLHSSLQAKGCPVELYRKGDMG